MSKWVLRFGVFLGALVLGLGAVFVAGRMVFGVDVVDYLVVTRPAVSPGEIQPDEMADDKAIYALVLKDEGFDEYQQVVREDSLKVENNEFEDPRSVAGAQDETIADFELKNKESVSMRPLMPETFVRGFIPKAEENALFPVKGNLRESWDVFYKRYPDSNGILSLSRIGFNGDHTQAIVYFGQYCGGLCGKGGFLLYMKSGGTWKKAGGGTMWVS